MCDITLYMHISFFSSREDIFLETFCCSLRLSGHYHSLVLNVGLETLSFDHKQISVHKNMADPNITIFFTSLGPVVQK